MSSLVFLTVKSFTRLTKAYSISTRLCEAYIHILKISLVMCLKSTQHRLRIIAVSVRVHYEREKESWGGIVRLN